MSFFEELKRRNVLRVALAYLAGAWLLLQVADVLIDNDLLPGGVFQSGLLILAIGFPVALILAWALEITPTGVKLEKDVDRSRPTTTTGSKKFDRIVIVVLAVAVAYFAYDKFASVDGPADKSIAVLPFVNMSEDAGNEYFADGISEEMLNLLTKIPELRVISRSSAFSFKGQDVNISEIAKQLNVAHILEGSVRKSGNQVRITAQLIDARTDTHLWSLSSKSCRVDRARVQASEPMARAGHEPTCRGSTESRPAKQPTPGFSDEKLRDFVTTGGAPPSENRQP